MADRSKKTSETIIPAENPKTGSLHLLAKFRQDVSEFRFGVPQPRRDITRDGTLDRVSVAAAASPSITLREYAKATGEHVRPAVLTDPIRLSQHKGPETLEVNTAQETTHINMCA
jgi:hypothetical protein